MTESRNAGIEKGGAEPTTFIRSKSSNILLGSCKPLALKYRFVAQPEPNVMLVGALKQFNADLGRANPGPSKVLTLGTSAVNKITAI